MYCIKLVYTRWNGVIRFIYRTNCGLKFESQSNSIDKLLNHLQKYTANKRDINLYMNFINTTYLIGSELRNWIIIRFNIIATNWRQMFKKDKCKTVTITKPVHFHYYFVTLIASIKFHFCEFYHWNESFHQKDEIPKRRICWIY